MLVFGAVHEGFTNNIPLDRRDKARERCCTSWLLVEHMDIPFEIFLIDIILCLSRLLLLEHVSIYSYDYDMPVCE